MVRPPGNHTCNPDAMVQNTLLTEEARCETQFEPGLPRVIGEPHGLQ